MTAPKIRFKEFSENWGSKKIIELADYVDYRGKTPKKVESGVLLVTAKNIKQGYLDYSASQEFIEESAFDDVMRRGKVELNDVLITTEAPLGNVASVDRTDIALAQRVIKYRGKTGLLDNLFLKQKFLSESFQEILKSKATGGTVQGIKGSVLHQIPLIVPSKEEQTKIATFLSAVDEKISQLSQKLHLLSQYKQGMMQKLFSQQIRFKADDGSEFGEWEKTTLGLTGKFIGGGTPSKEVTEFWQGSIPWISSSDLVDESIFNINITRYISTEALNQSATKLIPANSILIVSRVGVGKVAVTNRDICTSQDFTSLVLNNGNPVFFGYLIKSLTGRLLEMNQGTSIKGFVKDDLSNLKVEIPNLAEQTKIANFLSAIDQKIDVVSKQLDQAKLWKKGLLQQMFV
ncbi:hypothetical protein SDC9_86362 [bioreactor metagenome]|jgi:type I restriction enzyme S subunit|uniref:Type I restriction modification DNA specificity domain-containing protein n=1 Tax=bioreactor metagenome TaxID=1076179 RepID=A0A644ZHD8_9ZZZZ